MLLVYGVLLVAGSVMAASATASGVFIAGHVLQGLCTSLLLIAALPPLIVGYPATKACHTAIILNLCIFGAVALGPFLGGVQASAHAWRPVFWIVAGIALAALVLSLLTFQDAPPVDRSRPWDPLALGLAASGCAAAFFGASELLTHRFLDAITFVPLIAGLVLILALLVAEYRGRCGLLQARALVSPAEQLAVVAPELGRVLSDDLEVHDWLSHESSFRICGHRFTTPVLEMLAYREVIARGAPRPLQGAGSSRRSDADPGIARDESGRVERDVGEEVARAKANDTISQRFIALPGGDHLKRWDIDQTHQVVTRGAGFEEPVADHRQRVE
jgi:hypothetical protein